MVLRVLVEQVLGTRLASLYLNVQSSFWFYASTPHTAVYTCFEELVSCTPPVPLCFNYNLTSQSARDHFWAKPLLTIPGPKNGHFGGLVGLVTILLQCFLSISYIPTPSPT